MTLLNWFICFKYKAFEVGIYVGLFSHASVRIVCARLPTLIKSL